MRTAVWLLNQRLAEAGAASPAGTSRRSRYNLAELIRAEHRKKAENLEVLKKRHNKMTTLEGRLNHLEPLMAWKIVNIQEDVIDRLAAELLDSLTPATVNR